MAENMAWLIRLLLAGIVNACAGAIASFILWATYTNSNFASAAWTPSEIAASLTVGLGGVSAVRGLMHEHTVAVQAEKGQTALKEAKKDYVDSIANAGAALSDMVDKDPGGPGGASIDNA